MKKITLFLFTIALSLGLQAQSEFSKSLSGIEWVKIETKSSITLTTHDKNEVLIKISDPNPKPEKAAGLKLLGASGVDNTNVGFNVAQVGNNLIVENIRKNQEATIYLPKSQNVSVTNSWGGRITISGFSGEVEANSNLNGELVLENLSGPVTAYSLNHGIKVSFDDVNQNAPIVLSTTNGEIDVTIPSSAKADLELSTWNGDIYSNFDIATPNKDGLKSISSKNIKGAINGGGTNLRLKSTNGNIYLRKK